MRGRVVGYEESGGARLLGGVSKLCSVVARCCPPPCTLESIPSMSISSTTTTNHTFNRPTAAMVILAAQFFFYYLAVFPLALCFWTLGGVVVCSVNTAEIA